jgi:nucleotide-binding universal stress UspA family protein
LFGDTTTSLIKNSSYPVIAVPEGTKAGVPTNIVFATDLRNMEDVPASKISAIAAQLQASLHVVHVEVNGEESISPEPLMNALAGANASYHSINEKDVEEGLKQYVEQNNVDLVLIVPHKHNLYERLFFKGHTQAILHTMPVPVMSLR